MRLSLGLWRLTRGLKPTLGKWSTCRRYAWESCLSLTFLDVLQNTTHAPLWWFFLAGANCRRSNQSVRVIGCSSSMWWVELHQLRWLAQKTSPIFKFLRQHWLSKKCLANVDGLSRNWKHLTHIKSTASSGQRCFSIFARAVNVFRYHFLSHCIRF